MVVAEFRGCRKTAFSDILRARVGVRGSKPGQSWLDIAELHLSFFNFGFSVSFRSLKLFNHVQSKATKFDFANQRSLIVVYISWQKSWTKKNMQAVWLYGARFKRPWTIFEGKWLHTMSSHQPPGNQWHSTNKAPTIRQCCALKPTYQCSALRPTLVRVFILPTWILRDIDPAVRQGFDNNKIRHWDKQFSDLYSLGG